MGPTPAPAQPALPRTAAEVESEVTSLRAELQRLDGPEGRNLEEAARTQQKEVAQRRLREIEDETVITLDEAEPATGLFSKPKPSGIPGLTIDEFAEVIEGFEDGRAAARYLAGTADSAAARLVAARIEPHLDNVQIRVVKLGERVPFNFGPNSLGSYMAPGTNQGVKQAHGVSLNQHLILLQSPQVSRRSAGTNTETLLHELLHAATVERLTEGLNDAGFRNFRQMLEIQAPIRTSGPPMAKRATFLGDDASDLSRAAVELEDLATGPVREALLKYHSKLEPGGLKLGQEPWNVKELVTYALTNKPFQDFLAGIKIAGTEETLLGRFTSIVMRLLGFSPNERTALSEVIRLTDNLLDAERKALTRRTDDLADIVPEVKPVRPTTRDVPTDAASYEGTMRVDRVNFDSKAGLGNVPENSDVASKGFVVWMTPKEFLSLNPTKAAVDQATTDLAARIYAGESIAPPLLTVKQVDEGLRVVDHNGRGRMQVLEILQPDTPVPVHVFGQSAPGRGVKLFPPPTPETLESLVNPYELFRLLPDRRSFAYTMEQVGYRPVIQGTDILGPPGNTGVSPRAAWHVPSNNKYDPGQVYRAEDARAADAMQAAKRADDTAVVTAPALSETEVQNKLYLGLQRNVESLEAQLAQATQTVNREQAAIESLVPDQAVRAAVLNQAKQGVEPSAMRIKTFADDGTVTADRALNETELELAGRAKAHVDNKGRVGALLEEVTEARNQVQLFKQTTATKRAAAAEDVSDQVREDLFSLAGVTRRRNAVQQRIDTAEANLPGSASELDRQLVASLDKDIELIRAGQIDANELKELKQYRDLLQKELDEGVEGASEAELADITILIRRAEGRAVQRAKAQPLPKTELQAARDTYAKSQDELVVAQVAERQVDDALNALGDEVGAARIGATPEPLPPSVQARIEELDDLINKIEDNIDSYREVTAEGVVFSPRFPGMAAPQPKPAGQLTLVDPTTPAKLGKLSGEQAEVFKEWTRHQRFRLIELKGQRDSLAMPRNMADDTVEAKQRSAQALEAEILKGRAKSLIDTGNPFKAEVTNLRAELPFHSPEYSDALKGLLKRVEDGEINDLATLQQAKTRMNSQFVYRHPRGAQAGRAEIQQGQRATTDAIARNQANARSLARQINDPRTRLNQHPVSTPEHPRNDEFLGLLDQKRQAAARTDQAFTALDDAETGLTKAETDVIKAAKTATNRAEVEEVTTVLRPGPPRPSSMNATNLQFYDDGRAILYLYVTEGDPGKLVQELGKIVTRMLGPEDMDTVVSWLGKRGVKVTHKNGRFVGEAGAVAKAEDYFGEAFERYLTTGQNTDSRMKRIFNVMRDVVANTYRAVTRSGIETAPDINRFFSDILPKVAPSDGLIPVTRNAILKQIFDEDKEMGQVSALSLLDAEARRLGIEFDINATRNQIDDLLKTASDENPIGQNVVVELSAPVRFPELSVMSPKFAEPTTTFTLQDLTQLDQALKTNRMAIQNSRNMAVSFRGRQAMLEGRELTPSQMIDEVFRRMEEMSTGQKILFGGPFGRAFKNLAIGGDIDQLYKELTPYARGMIRAGERNLKQTLGDLGRIIYEGSRTNQRDKIYGFLGGEVMSFTRGGRKVMSSGQDLMDATRDNIRMIFDAVDPTIRPSLNRYLESARLAYNEGGLAGVGEMFAGRGPYALNRVEADQARRLVEQLTGREGYESTNMMSLFRNSLSIAEQTVKGERGRLVLNDPNKMILFLESVAYAGGQVRRGPKNAGTVFSGSSSARAKTLIEDFRDVLFLGADEAKLPPEIVQLYETSTNSFAITIGAVGAGRNVKLRWVGQGIAVPVDLYDGMRRMMMGLPVSPKKHADLFAMAQRLGLNIDMFADDFVQGRVTVTTADGVSQVRMQNTGFVLPRVARQRLAAAMQIARPDPAKLMNPSFFGFDDDPSHILGFIHNQYKIQLIRGRGMLKQGYFTMNTMDNASQVAISTNKQAYRTALANAPRVLLQNIMTLPGIGPLIGLADATAMFSAATGTFAVEKASAAAARFGVGPGRIAAAEKLRELLSTAGDQTSRAISRAMRLSVFDVRTSDVMDLRRPFIRIGDTLYDTKEVRRDFVEAGILASFDTRQLAGGLRNSGVALRKTLNRQRQVAADAGDIARVNAIDVLKETLVDYFRHIDDAAEAWSERERVGTAIQLMQAGFDSKTAATLTVRALYDYAGTMTKFEQYLFINMALPFWAYVKNANRQILDALCTARGAYKLGVIRRSFEAGPEGLQWLLYDGLVDPYGMDVDSMTKEEQEAYYAFINMIEGGMFESRAEIDNLTEQQKKQVEQLVYTNEELLGDPQNGIAPKTFNDLTEEQIDRLLNGYGGLPPKSVREAVRQAFLGHPDLYLENGKAYTRNEMIELAAQANLYHPNTLMQRVTPIDRVVRRPNPAAYGRYTRALPGFTFTMPMVDEMNNYIKTVQTNNQGKEGISIAGREAPFLHVMAPPHTIQGAYTHFLAQAGAAFLLGEMAVNTGRSMVRGNPDLSEEALTYDPEGTAAEYEFFVGPSRYTVSSRGVEAMVEQIKPIVELGRMPTVELIQAGFEKEGEPTTAPVRVSRQMYEGMQDLGPILGDMVYEVSAGQTDEYTGQVVEHPRYYVKPGPAKVIYRLTPLLADFNRHALRSELSELEGALQESEDQRVERRLFYVELLRFLGYRVTEEIGSETAYQLGFETPARSMEKQARQINR